MTRTMTWILPVIIAAGVGCSAPEAPATPESEPSEEFILDPEVVTGVTWEWVSTTTPIEKTVVPEPERYTILFEPGGRLRARFDCNRGGGEYRIAEGTLSLGPLISTRMACPEDSLDGPFMRDLERVTSFFVRDGELYLEMPFDSGGLRFRAASPTDEP